MRSLAVAVSVGAIVVAGSAAHATQRQPDAASAARASATPTVLGYAAAYGSCSAQGGGNVTIIPLTTPDGGPSYTASTGGVLTSVSYVEAAVASADARVRALVVRAAGPSYMVVAKTDPLLPVNGQTTTYPARLPMQPGDILAFNESSPESLGTACHSRPDGSSVTSLTDVGVNSSLVLAGGPTGGLPDISAVLEPDADGDGYGDLTQDGCAQLATTQSACPVPDTRLSKTVRKRTHRHKVTVSFAASVAGATFVCTLDKLAPKPCTSPRTVRARRGRHVLVIEAAYLGTMDPTPLVVRWRVVSRR